MLIPSVLFKKSLDLSILDLVAIEQGSGILLGLNCFLSVHLGKLGI